MAVNGSAVRDPDAKAGVWRRWLAWIALDSGL